MTQILMLALVLGVFLHDALPPPPAGSWFAGWPGYAIVAGVLAPKGLVVIGYALACRRTRRRLGTAGAARALRALDRLTTVCQLVALPLYALDLAIGALGLIRAWIGDVILLDELAVMLPTLGLLAAMWWAYYPIDRRLREAALLRRADEGLPIHPVWSRGGFIVNQARHHVALILGPLLTILAWSELVLRLGPGPVGVGWLSAGGVSWLTAAGAISVFVLAPLMIRLLWDTVPLPPGEVRDRLLAMCRSHGVGVRALLLWRTSGGMINAAVMGLVAPLRYILVTDALLEQVPRDQVEAVMAHELAHVKKHHMFWLIAAAIGALGALEALFHLVAVGLVQAAAPVGPHYDLARWAGSVLGSPAGLWLTVGGGAAAAWVFVFGWVSRRIERQADAFAVRHVAEARRRDRGGGPVAGKGADEAGEPIEIDPLAVAAMVGALQRLADLNHVPPYRRSWRHGSIAWRQAYLRSLIGHRCDTLPIDRQMRWVHAGCLLALAAAGLYAALGGAAPI